MCSWVFPTKRHLIFYIRSILAEDHFRLANYAGCQVALIERERWVWSLKNESISCCARDNHKIYGDDAQNCSCEWFRNTWWILIIAALSSPRLNDEWLICWIDSVASIDAPSCVLIRRLFVCARHFDNASDWFTHMICVWTIGQFQEYVHQKSLTITSVQCEWVYLIYLLNDRWNKIFSFIIKKVK